MMTVPPSRLADLDADDGEDRQRRVQDDVAGQHPAFGQPLRPRHPHVLLAERLQHRRAGVAHEDGGQRQAEADRRQDHRPDVGNRVAPQLDVADRRQPAQPEREDEHEQRRQQEVGDGDADERGDRRRVVERRVAAHRRQHPGGHGRPGADQRRQHRQLDRHRQAQAQLFIDRAAWCAATCRGRPAGRAPSSAGTAPAAADRARTTCAPARAAPA